MTNIQASRPRARRPSQWAAVGALNGVQSSRRGLRLTLENNRNVLVHRLKAFDGVKVVKPDGTFYCFPDFSAYNKDSQKLSEFLLERSWWSPCRARSSAWRATCGISFCGSDQGDHRGHRAHEVGARPQLAERAIHRRPQAGEGLAMKKS
jgi:hypothetical protein